MTHVELQWYNISICTHYHLYHRLRSIPSGITYNVSTLTHHKDVRCRSVHFISRTIASDVIRETVPCIRTRCVPRTEEIVTDALTMVLSHRNANRKSRLQCIGTNLLSEFKCTNLLELNVWLHLMSMISCTFYWLVCRPKQISGENLPLTAISFFCDFETNHARFNTMDGLKVH